MSAIEPPVPHRRLPMSARRLRLLARELRPVWIVLAVLAPVTLVAMLSPTPATLRALGLFLQLLGLTVVTAAVVVAWRRARMPAPRDWLRRLASALRAPDAVPAPAFSERQPARGSVTPPPLAKAPPGAGVEGRLRTVERNLEDLRRELARALRAHDKAVADVRQMVERDVRARAGALSSAQRSLADAPAAAVPLEVIGLAWLWAGILCATAADPIATALAWLAE